MSNTVIESMAAAELADPTLFVNIVAANTVAVRSKVNNLREKLNECHEQVVSCCTILIDSGKAFTSIWNNSELDGAMTERSLARDKFLRAAKQAFRQHSRRPERLSALLSHSHQLQKYLGDTATTPTPTETANSRIICEDRLAIIEGEIEALTDWNKFVLKTQAEVEDIESSGIDPPSMLLLGDSLSKLNKLQESLDTLFDESDNETLLEEARVSLQKHEKLYEADRIRIAMIAAAHFPHLFVLNPQLRFASADIGDEDGLFVEGRHLDHYSDRQKLHRGNHALWLARFDGEPCVLKEFSVDIIGRRRIRREAKLLRLLGEHPHIASVDAVFVHPSENGEQLAYLQMPYYSQGSLTSWIESKKPAKNVLQDVFASISQALSHVHGNGVVHCDIKLDNVLIDEHGTPYLCDFERSQAHDIVTSTTGFAGTMGYIAPEVRSAGPGYRPASPSDMFSFGVMLLLAFCDPTEYEQDADNTLKKITSSDENLCKLVRDLLQRDPAKRPSAIETNTYAFLDPIRLFEEANEKLEQAQVEEERVEREARETARRLRQAEADAQLRLQEEEEAAQERVNEAREKVNKQRRENQAKERKLKEDDGNLKAREQAVGGEAEEVKKDRAAVNKRKKEIDAENKDLEKEAKKIQKERAELGKIKTVKIPTPSYWTNKSTTGSNFNLEPISRSSVRSSVWMTLERSLNTGSWIRHNGQAPYDAHPYTHFSLGRAWRNENHALWKQYSGSRDQIRAECSRLRSGQRSPQVSTVMKRSSDDLPANLETSLNEIYAVHSTEDPNLLPKILEMGTNVRYSKRRWFGFGTYFGDDAKTSDNYANSMDIKLNQFPVLHKLVYGGHLFHPNSGNGQSDKGTYYMLICRVVLGNYAKVHGSEVDRESLNELNNNTLFAPKARDYEELNTIPGTNIHYHGLRGVKPDGQVEIIQFHDEYVYPEYLVAYHRTNKVLKEPSYRIWLLKQQSPPQTNMHRREDVQLLIAHTMIMALNCAVYGGFVRDFVVNNEPSNDVDVLLRNGVTVEKAYAKLQAIAGSYGGIRVQAPHGKGATKCCVVTSATGSWVKIEVDLTDPASIKDVNPPPGVDSNVGNLMFTQKGIELKVNTKGLQSVVETIAHCQQNKAIYYRDFNDHSTCGNETVSKICQRRLLKLLKRGWTCITPVPEFIMNKEEFKKFKPLIKPEAKWKKDWHKLR